MGVVESAMAAHRAAFSFAQFEDWEIKAKQLTEDIRRFRGYLALLERRPSEPDDDDGDYAELERSPAPSRLRRNNSLAT